MILLPFLANFSSLWKITELLKLYNFAVNDMLNSQMSALGFYEEAVTIIMIVIFMFQINQFCNLD